MLCPICLSEFEDRGETECPRCGAPLERAQTIGPSVDVIPIPEPAPRPPRGALAAVVARMAGVFAAVGLGLGVGVVLFMWSTGAFEEPTGLEDLPTAILGGLAVAIAFGFGLLIGVVMAIFAGTHAANDARSRTSAVVAGAAAAAVGHIALVATLGVVLIAGFAVFDQSDPSPTPSPPDELGAPCAEIFGADAPECQPEEEPDALEGGDEVTAGNVARLAVGIIPAALVGGLTSAILFTRRRRAV